MLSCQSYSPIFWHDNFLFYIFLIKFPNFSLDLFDILKIRDRSDGFRWRGTSRIWDLILLCLRFGDEGFLLLNPDSWTDSIFASYFLVGGKTNQTGVFFFLWGDTKIAVHFWAPTFKWGLSLANAADFSKPPEELSYPLQFGIAHFLVSFSPLSLLIWFYPDLEFSWQWHPKVCLAEVAKLWSNKLFAGAGKAWKLVRITINVSLYDYSMVCSCCLQWPYLVSLLLGYYPGMVWFPASKIYSSPLSFSHGHPHFLSCDFAWLISQVWISQFEI